MRVILMLSDSVKTLPYLFHSRVGSANMTLLNGTGIHPLPVEDGLKLRVILVGIGGATCSGKTTLAKHLRNILPGSVIVHQDDFAPPQEKIPIHPQYKVQDWDDPEGAIDWTRMVNSLREVKATGKIPPEHYSHDHLNEQKDIPINSETSKRWRDTFHRIEQERRQLGEQIIWVMVDGFLLYWDMDVVDTLDVRIFLRVPHDVLKQRRHERHGYHTAEGALWRDPPHYWEQIVWPAYVKAHAGVLEGGDLEHGKSNGKVRGLIVVEGLEVSMSSLVDNVCERLVDVAERTQ
ncbi:P-loop containing nucleoside triphosphate hydrolase [Abortiporus biennis]